MLILKRFRHKKTVITNHIGWFGNRCLANLNGQNYGFTTDGRYFFVPVIVVTFLMSTSCDTPVRINSFLAVIWPVPVY